jgi:hypothetical protein
VLNRIQRSSFTHAEWVPTLVDSSETGLRPASLRLNPICSICSTGPPGPTPTIRRTRFGLTSSRPPSIPATSGRLSASNYFVSCATTSAITSPESRRSGTPDFRRFVESSLFFAKLICFFTGRPPSSGIAPLSALINASLVLASDRVDLLIPSLVATSGCVQILSHFQ